MCCGITSCGQISYLDISRCKKFRQMENNTRLIEAHDIDAVRNAVFLIITHTGFLQIDGQALDARQLVELFLKLGKGVPVTGDQQEYREFGTECGHPALFDIAPTGEDRLTNIFHNTRAITANS